MTSKPIDALHDIHTATNDVLKGYREMSERAQPDIQPVVQRLIALHERHAADQAAELGRVRESGSDDTSLQGTVNKAVVIMRDWLSNLDQDVLPAVRKGEESLRGEYEKALQDGDVRSHPSIGPMLKTQMDAITTQIAGLPAR